MFVPRTASAVCLASLWLCVCAASAEQVTIDQRYERLDAFIGDEMYGPGGRVVLKVAYEALRAKHAAGEAQLVGLEDLWSHALQEGMSLFNKPEQLWGKTTAEETADMIGQTTIGPWQMTLWNIRDNYGPRYGIEPDWDNSQIYAFCREHPDVQAKMIIDYIQLSYETLGKRSPYAIQRYFWLEPFVKGELGQAEDWTRSVIAKPPPGGTWQDLTPEMKADTGFYAKQILLGSTYTKTGLLFWLQVTGDEDGIRETLTTWRDQKRLIVADEPDAPGAVVMENIAYVSTEENGGFTISPEDVVFHPTHAEVHRAVQRITLKMAWKMELGAVLRGDRSRRELALVFTGGDKGEGSQHILDTLKAKDVKASFFVTGDYVAQPGYDVYLQRMVDEGHYLGPHSHAHLLYAPWDDRNTSLVAEDEFKDDLQQNIDELRAFGAMPAGSVIYFIPPYEWYNARHADWAGDLGCQMFNFTPGSGSHRDWAPEGHEAFRPSTRILQDILDHEAEDPHGLNGHLLLLHLGGEREDKMYKLLGELIDALHERDYDLVRVDEMLAPSH